MTCIHPHHRAGDATGFCQAGKTSQPGRIHSHLAYHPGDMGSNRIQLGNQLFGRVVIERDAFN
jgi:hypothetical protein